MVTSSFGERHPMGCDMRLDMLSFAISVELSHFSAFACFDVDLISFFDLPELFSSFLAAVAYLFVLANIFVSISKSEIDETE